MRVYCSLFAAALFTSAGACSTAPHHNATHQEVASVSALPNRNLDVLFVIDSSGSMADEQQLLATNFPRFMQQLEGLPGGLPNVHIGVVTTDVGSHGGTVPGCNGWGNAGDLQLQGFTTTDGKPFLSNVGDPACNTDRSKNYEGELTTAFSQLAHVGDVGCGFEQPLEAMKRALAPDHASNAGFLRDDANLAVVIVTDEDDCSATGPQFYSGNPELGRLDSYRCFAQGVICDDDEQDPQRFGQRTNCRPRPNAEYQTGVQSYIDFLIARKGDERKVMVAGVIAPTLSTISVEADPASSPSVARLAHTCERGSGNERSLAFPAPRLAHFLSGFPGRSQTSSICDDDFSSVLSNVGASTARLMNAACLEKAPQINDSGEPDCEIVELSARSATGTRTETTLVPCGPTTTNETCYRIVEDAAACGTGPSKLRLDVQRAQAATVQGYAVARCAVAE